MWFETLRRAVKEIEKILEDSNNTNSQKELNAMELHIHKIFQEVYAVLGNATMEVKKSMRNRKAAARKEFQAQKYLEAEKVLEEIIEQAPENEVIDAAELDKPKKKKTSRKKKTAKKVEE